jgi:hypothetical protein
MASKNRGFEIADIVFLVVAGFVLWFFLIKRKLFGDLFGSSSTSGSVPIPNSATPPLVAVSPQEMNGLDLSVSTYGTDQSVRGQRNNNPLNLKLSNNAWKGKIAGGDGVFEKFVNMEYGLRANIINMRTQYNRGANTIRKLISVWAPPSDNNPTESYIRQVSDSSGIAPDKVFAWDKEIVRSIVVPMGIIESRYVISDSLFNRSWALM